MLLLVAAAAYFAVNIGEAYWRFYEFQDAMQQEVRFAAQISDDRIIKRLAALADSLGLPDAATEVTVDRSEGRISVRSEYTERIEFPLFAREMRFTPHAEGRY
jgi:hypothetical protein